MILPMMGFLFVLFSIGAVGGIVAALGGGGRIALPAAVALLLGSTSSCALSWGLGVGLESLFGSSELGGTGFFGGYAGGLLLGGLGGLQLGRALAKRMSRTAEAETL